MRKIKAWHFCEAGEEGPITSRGGLPVVIGETLTHDSPIAMCSSGLHASRRAIDALQYAKGCYVVRVDCWGDAIEGDDKLVARNRHALRGFHAGEVLRKFARMCALDVLRLWDPPGVVVEYLKTGRDDLRDAARAAARDAAMDAAGAAAMDAAWAAQNRRLERMLLEGMRASDV